MNWSGGTPSSHEPEGTSQVRDNQPHSEEHAEQVLISVRRPLLRRAKPLQADARCCDEYEQRDRADDEHHGGNIRTAGTTSDPQREPTEGQENKGAALDGPKPALLATKRPWADWLIIRAERLAALRATRLGEATQVVPAIETTTVALVAHVAIITRTDARQGTVAAIGSHDDRATRRRVSSAGGPLRPARPTPQRCIYSCRPARDRCRDTGLPMTGAAHA